MCVGRDRYTDGETLKVDRDTHRDREPRGGRKTHRYICIYIEGGREVILSTTEFSIPHTYLGLPHRPCSLLSVLPVELSDASISGLSYDSIH
jgi:hypothetical protein